MGNESPSPHQLLIESVTFWSIGVVLFICRILSRTIGAGSVKRLAFDDYAMTVTFMIYTTLLILIQVSAHHGTNLYPPEDNDKITADPQQVRDRIFGSKIVVALEQCMLFSTWGVKICMLTLFWRLTINIRLLHLYVKCIAVYVVIGFIVIMVTYYTVYCRPFQQYWQLPVNNLQCATYQNYSITQAVFNISSDAAMLAVPIPLLMKTQLRTRKKVILVCIMSLGVFTIIAAILNKVFNFASPLTTTYQIWYIREASTAIYVANLICLWPLLRKVFGLKAFQNSRQYRQHGTQRLKDSPGVSQSTEGVTNGSHSRASFSLSHFLPTRKTAVQRKSLETTRRWPTSYRSRVQTVSLEEQGQKAPEPSRCHERVSLDFEAGETGNVRELSSLEIMQGRQPMQGLCSLASVP
ncbi:hypothetical protein BDV25DRAFT_168764 [Aspergillus avenaceus]|uniref:Rhodopsin domain-containing protein n=1 Tax=Aspergillus avenaceus TaxID=36643 RepID=A0A5N6TNV2_ASPAV|nr:hypothetical protein BDV25DRAFT_168764 [Aspergillus avenaceus]